MSKTLFLNLHIILVGVGVVAFFTAAVASVIYLIQDKNLKNRRGVTLFNHLPDLSVLDKIVYRAIGFGFPILTLSIIIGSLLAKQTIGRFWTGTLRDGFSLVVWFLYALTLHVRLASRLRGRKIAWLSILAFIVIMIALSLTACGVGT